MSDSTDDHEDNMPYYRAKTKQSLIGYCSDIPNLDTLSPSQIIEIISNYLQEEGE